MVIAFTGNVFPFGPNIAYGGERILLYLVQELIKLGHDIYLFSREGTQPPEGVKDYIPVEALTNDKDVHFEKVKEYINKTKVHFDLYQCNYFGDGWDSDILSMFPYVELTWCAWCHMLHQMRRTPFNTVAYSKTLAEDFANVGGGTVMIHYGIPENLYSFQPEHDNYAVWIGKVEGGKMPVWAINLALAAGLKIVLMAPPYNTSCFHEQITPYLNNPNVFWVRGVDDKQKEKIMSRAKVFISSNGPTWKEHFGIVNIEALSMGVPIIAFNMNGKDCAIKKEPIIIEGEQGFFLDYDWNDGIKEIVNRGVPLIQKIDQINRQSCRERFVENFTSDRMANRFTRLYDRVIRGEKIENWVVA